MRWFADYGNGVRVIKDQDHRYCDLDRNGITRFGLMDEQNREIAVVGVEVGDLPFYRVRTTIRGGIVISQFYMVGILKPDRTLKTFKYIDSEGRIERFEEFNVRPQLSEPDWWEFPKQTV